MTISIDGGYSDTKVLISDIRLEYGGLYDLMLYEGIGVYPLKYFFSDGVTTADGSEKSIRELYKCLQELVDNEDKGCPLTDGELMDRLKEQGFTMARRTVAKYRESLHIPVARLRKE